MAVDNFRMMRGLPIPDCNFRFPPTHDTPAWSWSDISAGGIIVDGPAPFQQDLYGAYQWGTGSSLRVHLDSCSASALTSYIESSLTPFGLYAGPYYGAEPSVLFRIGVICRTTGLALNANDVLSWSMIGCEEDGTTEHEYSGGALIAGGENEQDWILLTDEIDESATNVDIRWWKVRFYFQRPSAGVSQIVWLDWVGIGLPFTSGSDYGKITSFYSADPVHSHGSRIINLSPEGSFRPQFRVQNHGMRFQRLLLNFGNHSETDKALINVLESWNQGSPTEETLNHLYYWNADHGTKQPLLLFLQRETVKFGFYADMVPCQWTPTKKPWWETGTTWRNAIQVVERLC